MQHRAFAARYYRKQISVDCVVQQNSCVFIIQKSSIHHVSGLPYPFPVSAPSYIDPPCPPQPCVRLLLSLPAPLPGLADPPRSARQSLCLPLFGPPPPLVFLPRASCRRTRPLHNIAGKQTVSRSKTAATQCAPSQTSVPLYVRRKVL